jgi:hypothetical protein
MADARCARCHRDLPPDTSPDAEWCEACRQGLIRGATQRAWMLAAVMAALFLWLLVWSGLMESPALVFFLALGAALAFVAYKVGRRVFFDVLRGRATGDEDR